MWRIHFDPDQSLLHAQLLEHVPEQEIQEFAGSFREALFRANDAPFRLLIDLRGLFPLDADGVAVFAQLKREASNRSGFQGIAVLVDSATVAMQQHNSRCRKDELITRDAEEISRFLEA